MALIFESALQIVGESGIDGLKMQKLAAKAVIATGTLYLYFEDKSALLAAMNVHYRQWLAAAANQLVSPSESFEERFRKTWYNYLSLLQRNPKLIVFLEQYQFDRGLDTQAPSQAFEQLSPFGPLIEEGQRMGILVKGPLLVQMALVTASAHKWVLWSQQAWLPPTTDYMHLAWDMIWKAISRG